MPAFIHGACQRDRVAEVPKFDGAQHGRREGCDEKNLDADGELPRGRQFSGPAAFAQNAEAEAAAARCRRRCGQPAPTRSFAERPLEKICRIGPRSREVEIQKIEPFKVFDNLYHVGPCYVSSWVLTTPQGDILFDTAQEPFVDMIEANIKKIGVDPHDIKYIIIDHGHIDHFGGAKRLQEFTGARVMATPKTGR